MKNFDLINQLMSAIVASILTIGANCWIKIFTGYWASWEFVFLMFAIQETGVRVIHKLSYRKEDSPD